MFHSQTIDRYFVYVLFCLVLHVLLDSLVALSRPTWMMKEQVARALMDTQMSWTRWKPPKKQAHHITSQTVLSVLTLRPSVTLKSITIILSDAFRRGFQFKPHLVINKIYPTCAPDPPIKPGFPTGPLLPWKMTFPQINWNNLNVCKATVSINLL